MQSAVNLRRASRPLPLPTLLALACALLSAAPAWALYKVVGPDGKVTYTDRPPNDQPAESLKSNGVKSATEGLPFELQRIVVKYPVTIYTSSTCSACDSGRELLKARGVPFQEKTIITTDDIRAFAKLEGTDQLPVIRIGQKQIIGFNQTEWVSYIDAAGFPAKSLLPLNYRWPAPAPLVPPPEVTPAPEGGFARPAPRREDSPQPSGDGSAPQGFRF